jgi:DNA-binding NtrC family response regulator
MGQAQQTRRAVLIVEDDAELRSLTAALLEDEKLDTIECESAEAALAIMLIGGQHVALIFADIRLSGVMDGIDLAHEVKVRWPLLPVVLTSGHSLDDHMRQFPPGVAYIPKPWQPLNLLVAAEEALAYPSRKIETAPAAPAVPKTQRTLIRY